MKPIVPLAAAIALGFGAAQFAHAQAIDAPPVPGLDSQYPAFDQVDSDGDGQVSREEAAAAGLEFDWTEADSDGTGSLTQEEYDSVFSSEAQPPDSGIDSDSTMDMESPDSGGRINDGLGTESPGMQ